VTVSRLHEQVQRFGASFNVMDFSPPDELRSSKKALAIAEFARDQGALEPYRRAVFEAHWRLRMNIDSEADLAQIAERAGLEPEAALAAANDPVYLERLNAKQAAARQQGVSGIPTFVMGNQRVTGCQPLAVLAAAAERAGAARRSP
jgi:predicted DsbA family dithiol-disulfide isomerase